MKQKKRLDLLVQEKYSHLTRNQIQSFIMQGYAIVDGVPVTKPGTPIDEKAVIELTHKEPPYVSRAGIKLAHALDCFTVDVTGLTALDAGLSTGGFTDCLLQRGIKHVYGVDVGYGQVHEKIRNDSRVTVLERTNLRYLERLPEKVDLVTLDLSFISITKVIDAVKNLMKDNARLIALIKPQFEAEKEEVGRGGIIKDPATHKKVTDKVINALEQAGFMSKGLIESPIAGTEGNKEFLALFERAPKQ